jgi:hypothetical protein
VEGGTQSTTHMCFAVGEAVGKTIAGFVQVVD